MVADWIISAGLATIKCVAIALTFVACIGLYLVESQNISDRAE